MAMIENATDQLRRAEGIAKAERRRGIARTIRRVGVLGAGTMGARVAAHFANAGVPSLLLSSPAKEGNRNNTAVKAIEGAVKARPAAFFSAEQGARLVKPGNYEDNLNDLAGCDWIIETTSENLGIKRELWKKVAAVAKPDAILSTCTSSISISAIVEGFPQEIRKRFLGTHFFNPTRYLHLMELIPGPETDPEILEFISEFADKRMGKGVVPCKDTPSFVANRLGAFWGAAVTKTLMDGEYTIEEADALTGSLIGLPNSASYRLLDLVGLDIWATVNASLYADCVDDPWRERYQVPEFQKKMIERNLLGDKVGQGFYKKVGKGEEKEFWAIDWKTVEYHKANKPRFASVDAVRDIEDVPERLRRLVKSDDRAGQFLWKVFSDYVLYASEMVPLIADRMVEVDRAMRWGYAHKFGPFELFDALGFQDVVCRLQQEGRTLPRNLQDMVAAGATSLYRHPEGQAHTEYFDFGKNAYAKLETAPGSLCLADIKRANGVVKQNAGASLIDLGDGVLCCEFHSKMNSIGEDIINMLYAGLDELNTHYDAMVIANEGENFSVGANLVSILLAAQEGEWDELNEAVNRLQQVNMALKYAPKPVISAPFGRTLGGGSEIAMHTIPQASAELYMGQVELGVGLIPAGGGCKELLARLKEARKVFELIAFAKVSMSAVEAKNYGFLDASTPITMNPERLVADAKALALAVAPNYVPGVPRTDIKVCGDATYGLLKLGVWSARQGEYITDHDVAVGEKLAYVLAGGHLAGEHLVSEQYLLDLEREAFLSLCGTVKTQERIAHMLKTGKPLRN